MANTQAQIFLNDLQAGTHEVRFEADEQGRQIIKGLPLMRPGKWNGVDWTADGLKALAANFARVQAEDSFEPALKPMHGYDADGKPLSVDGRSTQGWFKALSFDEKANLLVGDVLVTDSDLPGLVQNGTLRYLSTEIDPAYTMGTSGEKLGEALVGVSWVDYPAVRGMPWELVMNSQEFGDVRPQAPEREGGKPNMSLKERIKKLVGTTPTEEDIESLAAEVETLSQKPTGEKPEKGTDPPKPAADEETVKVLAQMQETIDGQATQLAAVQQQARAQNAQGIVDKLVESGHLPPAQKARTLAVVTHLASVDEKVKIMAQVTTKGADGEDVTSEQEQEVSLLQAFTDAIIGSGPKVMTSRGDSVVFTGSEDPTNAEEAAQHAAAETRAAEIRASYAK